MRTLATVFMLLALSFAAPASAQQKSAAPDPLLLRPGYATLLKFDKPIATVVIGDPVVADVLPRGDRAVMLSGRAVGSTNLIVIDADNNEIYNGTVIVRVSPPPVGEIHVHRPNIGANASPTIHDYTAYNCQPECALVGHLLAPKTSPLAHQRNLEQGQNNPCQNPDDIAADGSRCGDRAPSAKPGGRP